MNFLTKGLAVVITLSLSSGAIASIIEFSDGDVIKSDDFNTNFEYLNSISTIKTDIIHNIDEDDIVTEGDQTKIGDEYLTAIKCTQTLPFYSPTHSDKFEIITVDYTHLIEDSEAEKCESIKFSNTTDTANTKIVIGSEYYYAISDINTYEDFSLDVHVDEKKPEIQFSISASTTMYPNDTTRIEAINTKTRNFKIESVTYASN